MLHERTHFGYHSPVQRVPASAPKYRQIYDSLKQAIALGEYRAGQRLPTESDLVKSFEASRVTVNRALRELQLAGFFEGRESDLDGPSAAAETVRGARIASDKGWTAPSISDNVEFPPLPEQ